MISQTRLLAVTLVALLSPRVVPGADLEVFAPKHVAKLRVVTSVSMAPDGSRIAYLLSVPRKPLMDDDGPAWSELHLVDLEGRDQGFITGEVNVSEIAWMPDGRSVTFLAKRGKDEHKSLYKIGTNGGEAQKLLSIATDITAYSLSPDGLAVSFLATEPTPKPKLDIEKKGFNQVVVEEGVKAVKVWVSSLADGATPPKVFELVGSASELKWSPAGKQISVALAPTSSVDDGFMKRQVHIIDAISGQIQTKVENVGKLGKVAWSPDGSNLAMISAADIHDPHQGNLFVVPATGGSPKSQNPLKTGHVADIAWINAETVGYVVDDGVRTRLGQVEIGSGEVEMLEPDDQPIVTAISGSRDAAIFAMIGESSKHPAEVFLIRRDDHRPHQLTKSNPWLSGLSFASQEVITYKAQDGISLQGILIRPLGVKPGEKSPLVLTVHGGPESHVKNGWLTSYSNPGQVLAARGFAVFYPNYRGSTGRGVEFSKLGQGDPAGKEFDDLVDAVDHFVTSGLADTTKVGITGGSYGGYATAWCSTHYSERFAAGVMFVGISDKISKTGTTDIPEEEFLVHARKRPWDDWEGLLKHSPIYHVKGAKTPLIILHGKEDPRVFPGQSMELFRFLKVLNQAPVRLVLYPGEGHGNIRAASRLDFHLRMLQWFEHYLKGKGGEAPAFELDYASLLGEAIPAK